MSVQETEEAASEVDGQVFTNASNSIFYLHLLSLDMIKDSLFLVVFVVLFPLGWSAQVSQVREVQVHLDHEFCLQVFWLYVKLCSEQNHVINFNLLLTVPNEEGL